MITVWNKDNGTVCCIDELVLNWGEHISHLYYDQDTEVVIDCYLLFTLFENNLTGLRNTCQTLLAKRFYQA